ncbi:MAG: hypothetical protein IT467_11940 [Dokdonella sp.]|nr:hypothetical protein [Dokdonella sp.]MCC7256629.1 hypothetical protein [Dokdonella sp.]
MRYAGQAKLQIHFVCHASQADLKTYFVKYSGQVGWNGPPRGLAISRR